MFEFLRKAASYLRSDLLGAAAPQPRRRSSYRPAIESLEAREVMSTTGVLTSASDWMGALHEYALAPGGQLNHMASEYGYAPGLAGGGGDYWWETSWQNVGGPQLTQISASRDSYGHAECFGLDINGHLEVFRNYGSMTSGSWSYVGGNNVMQISADNQGVVYALCYDHTMWKFDPNNGGWHSVNGGAIFGGPSNVLQISAGSTDVNGSNTLWALDSNHAVWELNWSWYNAARGGWNYYGGWASQISATAHNNVYVLSGNEVYTLSDAMWFPHWVDTGLNATTISAGTDWTGSYDRVCAVHNGALWEYSQYGPQQGWRQDLMGGPLEVIGPVGRQAVAIAASEWAAWGQGDRCMYIDTNNSMNLVSYDRETGHELFWNEGGYWLTSTNTFFINPAALSYYYLLI